MRSPAAARRLLTAVITSLSALLVACGGDASVTPVPVERPPVAEVEVSPATRALAVGDSTTIGATVKDAAGRPLSGRSVIWSVEGDAAATVTAAGLVTATAPGVARVIAMSEGKRGVATITVNAPPPPPPVVASVVLDAHDPVLEAGGTHLLSATALDAAGRVVAGRTVSWSSSDAAVLTIAADGLATARATGTVWITAMVEGKSASAQLTVDAPPGADLLYQRSVASANELYTLSLAAPGAAPVRINAGTVSRRPSASPDGTRVAFAVSMTELNGTVVEDIFAVDRNGMNMRQLTTAAGIDDMPAWSPVPGASLIAFVHLDPPTGRSDIWIMNADGTAKQNLTADLPADVVRREPAWSPDGQWIAFVSSRNAGGAGQASLWIMRADGTQKRELSQNPGSGFDRHPSWSPDGSRIAFSRGGLAMATVATGAVTIMTYPGQLTDPAWSPDGRHIAFAWRNGQPGSGAFEIHTVRADGTDPRLRVRDPSVMASAVAPAWIRR